MRLVLLHYFVILTTTCNIVFDNIHTVLASHDPSSSGFSSSRPNSFNSNTPSDFTYRQSYQLNLTPSNDTDDNINNNVAPTLFVTSVVNNEIIPIRDNNFSPNNAILNRSTNKELSQSTTRSNTLSSLLNSPIIASMNTWMSKSHSINEVKYYNYDNHIDDDEEDDDNDDDDNSNDDGQSSMLSTASLQRKILLSTSKFDQWTNNNVRINRINYRHNDKIQKKKVRSSSFNHLYQSALAIRGGGTDSPSIIQTDLQQQHWISHLLLLAYQSQVSRNLMVSAIVTLIFEAMIGHILEFLKIIMQTSNESISYIQVLQTITAEKGILGLWDGFCPWGIVQAVCKGAVFGLAHATALQILKPLAEKKYIPMALALTLAGGIGGGFQGYILSPTLLLKTRVMTNPVFREKMSALRTTLLSFTIGYDVVKQEGIGALMKGANVFATKRVFDWASRYYFADLFEDLFTRLRNGAQLSVGEKSAASLLGGVFSTLVTLPLDVLVAKTQDAKKAGIQVSPIKLFQDELREKGWNGIYNAYMRGFEARLLHVCLTTVVIKTGTPIAYEAIFGTK